MTVLYSTHSRPAASTAFLLGAFLLVTALALAACGRQEPPAAPAPSADATAAAADIDEGLVSRTTRRAIERAREKIADSNISVGGGSSDTGVVWRSRASGGDLPRAEISPQGDFIVDGRNVPVDAAQRELLLAHRANIVAIADAGMEIGIQGARLGLGAARDALGAVLRGQTDDFEQRVAAEGQQLEIDALRICDRLPALLVSQQALADALPAFEPYARTTQADIDDCRRDTRGNAGGSDTAHATPASHRPT